MRCLFFCSEEHAREFRSRTRQPDGHYLTFDQAAFSDRLAQGALFPVTGEGR